MILDKLVQASQRKLERDQALFSKKELKELQKRVKVKHSFKDAIQKEKLSFILEVKKASPSKGLLVETFDPVKIAKDYEKIGADAISCLTEEEYFLGSDKYLQDISNTVSLPILKKDFMIDTYQIDQAKVLGASCILLIVAILSPQKLQEMYCYAKEIGLDAIVEVHNVIELDIALAINADIIGINNRDLKTFQVNLNTTNKLLQYIPDNILTISESGIYTADDVCQIQGVDAVLIGESFMKAENKEQLLRQLHG